MGRAAARCRGPAWRCRLRGRLPPVRAPLLDPVEPVWLPAAIESTEESDDRRSRAATRSVPGSGWTVVAAKEFGDHLLSARFFVLVIVLGLAAAIPLYFAAAAIREVASGVTDTQAIFIALFWLAPDVGGQFTLPSVTGFLAYVAPLLGLAFAFDSINGERAQGTLPRLLSQPIHRDDVVNGKFVAGLAVIGAGARHGGRGDRCIRDDPAGIVPAPAEILRIVLWVLLTFVYVSLWLAFGMLLSVVVRRAATSALVGFGAWLLFTFFGGLIVSLLGGVIAPVAGSAEERSATTGSRRACAGCCPTRSIARRP